VFLAVNFLNFLKKKQNVTIYGVTIYILDCIIRWEYITVLEISQTNICGLINTVSYVNRALKVLKLTEKT